MSRAPILGMGPSGPLRIDVEKLIESRLLIQGASNAGKSYAVRRLLEQTHGSVQQIVLDVEDEYASLRERFPYVLGGPGRDFPVEPRSAALLARRLMELGVSAVLNLYELKRPEQVRFVKAFLETLIALPKALQRDALVVLEEATRLAPQAGKDAECTEAVIDLMARGRKRGLCGVAVCPRISDLHKSVVAQCQNRLIGATTLDADVKRAAYELGFAGRDEARRLVELPRGEFFAFGPALSREVVRVRIGECATPHGTKRGQRASAPPPPPEKVRAVLAKLSDLPAEAAEEARTVETLSDRVRELERELRAARAGTSAPSPEQLERARAEGARAAEKRLAALVGKVNGRQGSAARLLEQAIVTLGKLSDVMRDPLDVELLTFASSSEMAKVNTLVSVDRSSRSSGSVASSTRQIAASKTQAVVSPRSGQGRMLQVLAQLSPSGATEAQWAVLAHLKRTGGTWATYLSRLRTAGYVEHRSDGLWYATDDGLLAAGEVPAAPSTPDEVLAMWRGKPGMAQPVRLAAAVMEHGEMTRDELASTVGLTGNAGTFSTYLSRCKTAGLIEVDGTMVRPAEALR